MDLGKMNDCPICLSLFKSTVRSLPCNHTFCSDCINNWFACGTQTCPLCRYIVPVRIERTKACDIEVIINAALSQGFTSSPLVRTVARNLEEDFRYVDLIRYNLTDHL